MCVANYSDISIYIYKKKQYILISSFLCIFSSKSWYEKSSWFVTHIYNNITMILYQNMYDTCTSHYIISQITWHFSPKAHYLYSTQHSSYSTQHSSYAHSTLLVFYMFTAAQFPDGDGAL